MKRAVYFLLIIFIFFVCTYSFTQKPETDSNLTSNKLQNISAQSSVSSNQNQLRYSSNQEFQVDGDLPGDNSQNILAQLNVSNNQLSYSSNHEPQIDMNLIDKGLQNILGQFDISNDQLHYSIFTPGSDLTFTSTLKQGPNGNVFGIYSYGDETNQLILFPSEAQVGDIVTAYFIPTGTHWHALSYGIIGGISQIIDENDFPTPNFGFYLTDGTTWY